jgi:hypothetical protein
MKAHDQSLSPEVRARLARKGQRLYAKACGGGSSDFCAESFALHHIKKGQPVVARDLLVFLEAEIERLRGEDPHSRLTRTANLADRIGKHLQEGEG